MQSYKPSSTNSILRVLKNVYCSLFTIHYSLFIIFLLFIVHYSLFTANAQDLWGMTSSGGSINVGILFEYNLTATTMSDKTDFIHTNGNSPDGSLLEAKDGKLYGMTFGGGATSYSGVIFSYDPSLSAFNKLHDFRGDRIGGANPMGDLIQASDGNLYGMTLDAGVSELGNIFSYNLSTSTYTDIHDFDGIHGEDPGGSLIQANDGNLYGMTNTGGTSKNCGSGCGVIFKYDFFNSQYAVIYNFNNGDYPWGSLIQATDGLLYGMTQAGGANALGNIFSYNLSASTYTDIHDFDGSDGELPWGSLIQATDGNLYGMTHYGTHGTGINGVIFRYNLSLSTYTKLVDFDGTVGGLPEGDLVQARDGNLYGMTSAGGSNNLGVIFQYNLSAGSYKKLIDFNVSNGATPYGNLIDIKVYQKSLCPNTFTCGNTFVDPRDGNIYPTVRIGTQCWFTTNLKATKYFNGDSVKHITNGTAWGNLTTGAWCDYNNDGSNGFVYGHLYNWFAVNDSRSLCPAGWYVPTANEWTILINFLGGGAAAENALKETGTAHWNTDTGANNSTGFTALPDGYCDGNQTFQYEGTNLDLWSSTRTDANEATIFYLNTPISIGVFSQWLITSGMSVRCMKDY